MRTFTLEKPSSLKEAIAILEGRAGAARPVAGGTALFPLWKQRIFSLEVVIDLSRIPELRRLSVGDGTVEIGALIRIAELEDSSQVRERLPLLHAVSCNTANRRIREMATLGGSLAHGESASDVNAGALASDCTVHLLGPVGPRSVAIHEFFKGFYQTAAGPEEIVTHVSSSAFTPQRRYAYLKYSPRSRSDKPTLGVAVNWLAAAAGRCHDVRIALSNVGVTPARCPAAEQVLEGQVPTAAAIDGAADAAYRTLQPIGDLTASSEYKREMARVFVRRAVQQAAGHPAAERG